MPTPTTTSQRLGKILSPALRFWLRSVCDRLDRLELEIMGKNKQILTGYIPKVSLTFEGAVYQALHFTRGWAIGENIRINLGQVIQGKPLQILEPITVTGEFLLAATDLKTSLNSPLLATALKDFLFSLVHPEDNLNRDGNDLDKAREQWEIHWHDLEILAGEILLMGILTTPDRDATPLHLRSGLQLRGNSQLYLSPLAIDNPYFSQTPPEFSFDLGTEVAIQTLSLSPDQLFIKGEIVVKPTTEE